MGAGFDVGLCNILWLGVLVEFVVDESYLWNGKKTVWLLDKCHNCYLKKLIDNQGI